MLDERLKKMADLILEYSLNIQPGERVLIESSKNCSEMIKYMIKKIYSMGAIPFVKLSESDIKRDLIIYGNREQYELMEKAEQVLLNGIDVFIDMMDSTNGYDMSDIPIEKRKEWQQLYFKPIRLETIMNNKRWITVDYPSISSAIKFNMSTEAYEDYFFDAVLTDYNSLSKNMIPLKKILDAAKKVHILSDDTDIEFGIKNQEAVICDGKINIPDGEVFIAPDLGTANGIIRYNTESSYQGKIFSDIELEFSNGLLKNSKASSHQKELIEILNFDEGSTSLGEFAFGTNPNIKRPIRNILFDEKILGSIHLAMGASHRLSDNENRSSIHWDMVKMLTKEYGGGKVYIDGKLILDDGLFIPSELQELNNKTLSLRKE